MLVSQPRKLPIVNSVASVERQELQRLEVNSEAAT
jgi:hypothetical protein